MSDFGAMVSVHRADGTSTTPADEALIKQIAGEIAAPRDDCISEFADFDLRFGGSLGEVSEGVMVGLTEYWVGNEDGNEGLEDQALIERDRPIAERFAEQLQAKLGDVFQFQAYCGDW